MRLRSLKQAAIAGGGFLALWFGPNQAIGGDKALAAARAAVARGLEFLENDAANWRTDHGCATCHHGTMTVWAVSEAKRQGYPVSAEVLSDNLRWTKDQFVHRFKKPRDPRPGWNLVSTPAIYLGVMSQDLPILSRDEIHQVAGHLARHQDADGSWETPPPANGAPPAWESRETVALLAYLAWEPQAPAGPDEAAAARRSRAQTAAWLRAAEPSKTVQATGLRLLLDVRTGKPAKQCEAGVAALFDMQNSDGGWSQVTNAPSDAYATGQALWVLSLAGVKHDRSEVARAVAFLAGNQRQNGSWPMTPRNHPGVKTTRNPVRSLVPITYFGSAWATLGLVRLVPPDIDAEDRREHALDAVRALGGTYKVDSTQTDQPVVRVDVPYEVDDEDLATLVGELTVFPRLETLRLNSPKITDAGISSLKRLPGLRSAVLERAAITDAGLAQLATLPYLDDLNLKGTKVTDAGIAEFRRSRPQAKIER